MKFLDLLRECYLGDKYIGEVCTFDAGYENPQVLFFGAIPEERQEEEFNLSKLTADDIETICKVITGGVSCRIYDKGLSNKELLILDNLYASCCTFAINHLDIYEQMFPYGLLTIESDTQAYFDLKRLGDIAQTFKVIGIKGEDNHNKRLRQIWLNFDKNLRILFDMPNVELINRQEDEGYKPFINNNTFSFGRLAWYRLQELTGKDLLEDSAQEKKYLSNRVFWLEKSVNKGKVVLDDEDVEFLKEKLEDINNRYNL